MVVLPRGLGDEKQHEPDRVFVMTAILRAFQQAPEPFNRVCMKRAVYVFALVVRLVLVGYQNLGPWVNGIHYEFHNALAGHVIGNQCDHVTVALYRADYRRLIGFALSAARTFVVLVCLAGFAAHVGFVRFDDTG